MNAYFISLSFVLFITSIESKLTTFVLGDSGKVGTQLDTVTASVINQAKSKKPDFMILAGDNNYENGLQSLEESESSMINFNTFWKGFDSDELNDIPFYAVLGNHDWHKSANQEINCDMNCEIGYAYLAKYGGESEDYDSRFNLEADYYSKIYDVDDETRLQIVYIDTVTLAFDTTLKWLDEMVNEGEADIEVLEQWTKSRKKVEMDAVVQLQWIEDELKHSTADYLLVVGHYPVYGVGEHGSVDEMLALVRPLLIQYSVDMFVNGHSHTLEHIPGPEPKDSVEYFTSGAASKTGTIDYDYPTANYASTIPGYMIIEVDESNMEVSFIDANEDAVAYSYTIPQTREL